MHGDMLTRLIVMIFSQYMQILNYVVDLKLIQYYVNYNLFFKKEKY